VTAFTTTSITVKDRHGNSTTYTTTGTTTYSVGKTAGAYADLANGEQVQLKLTTSQTVTAVTIDPVVFFGTVTGVSGSVISLTGFHGTALSVTVSGTTTYTSGGASSSLSAVVTGVKISAVGLPGSTAGSLNASSVNIGGLFGHKFGHTLNHTPSHVIGHSFGPSHGKSFGHSHH
jgi:hypothetical protein